MKAIMISINPKWVAKILNGEKTIEIRKTMPKCDLPIDVYIYCTKDKEHLYRHFDNKFKVFREYNKLCSHNGKVVAKFTLKEIRLAKYQPYVDEASKRANKLTCLTDEELDKYLNCKDGYGWKIDDLVIFDKPKELSEFGYKACVWDRCYRCRNGNDNHCLAVWFKLTKAPQSWCYVEVE